MIKKFVSIMMILLSYQAMGWDAPEILSNACYEGCTPEMEKLYNDFLATPTAPKYLPGMYSGECHHLSRDLNPDQVHYIGLLLDDHPKGAYMAPVLQFFGEGNDMADWSLQKARQEMSPDWIDAGRITTHPTSMTAHVEDEEGFPALIYWARQNQRTKEIYFLALLRQFFIGFCRLTPNVQGLP